MIAVNQPVIEAQAPRPSKENLKTIYLAGGCFWGMQSYFDGVQGVVETTVGYANSTRPNPKYEDVDTDYAETIRVEYNASVVPLKFILGLYFDVIDPTILNRQGNDVGRQYRTGIYYTNAQDEVVAKEMLQTLAKKYPKPIVVECIPLKNFYPAEAYHQDYLKKHPSGYCHIGKDKIARAHAQRYVDKEQLRRKLTPMQYHVTQEQGTEPPFKNEYYDHYAKGIYVDVVDGTPLFVSTDKFESGCGWPAFSRPIDDKLLVERTDTSHGMVRVEVRSKSSGSHLGHVFEDGPKELGGERYCINSASLRFIPLEKMKEQGYGDYIKYVK